ncbi:hypothetical protein [Consotaella aegiceratis]|uniref:hypothetical protein n=1 Tax=Consotaella aegiceratis TaxID=3097961 RepID=UPI002F3F5A91
MAEPTLRSVFYQPRGLLSQRNGIWYWGLKQVSFQTFQLLPRQIRIRARADHMINRYTAREHLQFTFSVGNRPRSIDLLMMAHARRCWNTLYEPKRVFHHDSAHAWPLRTELLPEELCRLKAPDERRTRSKKIVAGLAFDREMVAEIIRRKR